MKSRNFSLFQSIAILCFVLSSSALFAQRADPSIKDLDFLIGEWNVQEAILPGHPNQYEEQGIRTCSYYLNGSFIKCEATTTVLKSGKKRFYVYFINYDKEEGCFWATNLANDFPLHGLHKWFLNTETKVITTITPKNVNGDRFFRGTISYADKDKLIWEGWASKYSEDKEWKYIFKDVATRAVD